MQCTKCGKHHEGYRCPYCGHFLLDDPALKNKKYSLYHKQMKQENRTQWPLYIFLIVFVGGWLGIISWFILH